MAKKIELSYDFLIRVGFTCERKWDNTNNQFRLVYIIEGYDCDVIIAPFPQVAAKGIDWMPPKEQVDNLSSIDDLKNHHTGHWQAYINSLKNHFATFEYEEQLLEFFKLTDVEYKIQ